MCIFYIVKHNTVLPELIIFLSKSALNPLFITKPNIVWTRPKNARTQNYKGSTGLEPPKKPKTRITKQKLDRRSGRENLRDGPRREPVDEPPSFDILSFIVSFAFNSKFNFVINCGNYSQSMVPLQLQSSVSSS